MPTLKNWIITDRDDGQAVLFGEVFGSDKHADGSYVRTSVIQWMNPDQTKAQTRNTLYNLENKTCPK